MDLRFTTSAPENVNCDLLVTLVDDEKNLDPRLSKLDGELNGAITRELNAGLVKGGKDSKAVLAGAAENAPKRIALIGIDRSSDDAHNAMRRAGARIAGIAREYKAADIAVLANGSAADQRALTEGLLLGAFKVHKYTNKPSTDDAGEAKYEGPTSVTVVDATGDEETAARTGFTIASAQNWARDLANAPANLLPPIELAAEAKRLADKHEHLSFKELNREEIKAHGMGMFSAVAQGALDDPRLIVLEWNPPSATESDAERLALVGKAVTFDTGGISIKPSAGMEGMKLDKSGGCAVLGAMRAIAELNVERRVLAVVGATMNMPDGGAYRPGDVVTALDGTTVEIISTDAEGRLVLGDCITYARELGCGKIVEASTLTGAMVIALGHHYTGAIATPDSSLIGAVENAAKATGDHVWHLPIHKAYTDNLKTDCADYKNSGPRDAGSLSAGGFLNHFAKDTPFVHLDVAGTGMISKPRDWFTCKGATGAGMPLMVELAANQQ